MATENFQVIHLAAMTHYHIFYQEELCFDFNLNLMHNASVAIETIEALSDVEAVLFANIPNLLVLIPSEFSVTPSYLERW